MLNTTKVVNLLSENSFCSITNQIMTKKNKMFAKVGCLYKKKHPKLWKIIVVLVGTCRKSDEEKRI